MNTSPNRARLANAAVSTALLGALFFFAGTPRAQADDRGKCRERIERAEAKLDQAARKHGERSRQAESRRRELNEQRERCWNQYHGWWEGHERRWHEDRDWDRDRDREHRDHDHDRDHDRDHNRDFRPLSSSSTGSRCVRWRPLSLWSLPRSPMLRNIRSGLVEVRIDNGFQPTIEN